MVMPCPATAVIRSADGNFVRLRTHTSLRAFHWAARCLATVPSSLRAAAWQSLGTRFACMGNALDHDRGLVAPGSSATQGPGGQDGAVDGVLLDLHPAAAKPWHIASGATSPLSPRRGTPSSPSPSNGSTTQTPHRLGMGVSPASPHSTDAAANPPPSRMTSTRKERHAQGLRPPLLRSASTRTRPPRTRIRTGANDLFAASAEPPAPPARKRGGRGRWLAIRRIVIRPAGIRQRRDPSPSTATGPSA